MKHLASNRSLPFRPTILFFLTIFSFISLGTLAQAANATLPVGEKKLGKTGRQLVGISSICYGPRLSLETAEKFIDQAALDQPDLILMTEGVMQNSPRSASREEKDAKSDLLPEGGPITKLLSRKAKQYHTYLMASYWRKDPHGKGRHNSAVLFDREGKVVGHYDKMFPTVGEIDGGVIPGTEATVFDTDFGRIAAAICFDLNFEELFAEYKKQNVELLCFLSMFRGGRMVPAIAMQNRMFIASSVPHENGVVYDPLGRKLNESSHYQRIIFTRINLDSKVVHIDFNIKKIPALKKKYGPYVQIEAASPEGIYLISSLHPEKTVEDFIEEFDLETLDEYLDRSRARRREKLQEFRSQEK